MCRKCVGVRVPVQLCVLCVTGCVLTDTKRRVALANLRLTGAVDALDADDRVVAALRTFDLILQVDQGRDRQRDHRSRAHLTPSHHVAHAISACADPHADRMDA